MNDHVLSLELGDVVSIWSGDSSPADLDNWDWGIVVDKKNIRKTQVLFDPYRYQVAWTTLIDDDTWYRAAEIHVSRRQNI